MIMAIVPAYNEEKRIAAVVADLLGHVDEVVVINDCSADDTAKKAHQSGATVLSHHINRGQGAALETGHAYARKQHADFVIHFDGDGQFSVTDIPQALEHIQKHKADVLLGSRFLDTRTQMPKFKRYILHPIAREVENRLTGLTLSDIHNGFRVLSKRALQDIVITQDGMAHASEIPRLIAKYNLKHVEFPVQVTYHEYGQSAFGGIKIIKDLLFGNFVK